MNKLTNLFAWRYFSAKKSTNAINIIAWISVLAMAVGTAALILVLSVFNGFEGLVKSLYADFYADMRIEPVKGKKIILNAAQYQKLQLIQGVAFANQIVEEKAVLVNEGYQAIIYIKGVDSNYNQVNAVDKHIEKGSFLLGSTNEPMMVVGAGIENAVGTNISKAITPYTLYTPNKTANYSNIQNAMNAYNVGVSGSFAIQQEFDDKYAFTNIGFLRYMLNMPVDECNYLELKLAAGANETAIANQVKTILGNKVVCKTRYEQNRGLFAIMQMEKWVIYGILSLILIVAAFNMIGALTMMVIEKKKDIVTLQAIGADEKLIKKIFIRTGLLLAFIGSVFGMGVATLLCVLQQYFHFIKLQGGTFIIDYYPVQLLVTDYALVVGTVILIAFLAAYFPSVKASKRKFALH